MVLIYAVVRHCEAVVVTLPIGILELSHFSFRHDNNKVFEMVSGHAKSCYKDAV
jgi:hypothetical protein